MQCANSSKFKKCKWWQYSCNMVYSSVMVWLSRPLSIRFFFGFSYFPFRFTNLVNLLICFYHNPCSPYLFLSPPPSFCLFRLRHWALRCRRRWRWRRQYRSSKVRTEKWSRFRCLSTQWAPETPAHALSLKHRIPPHTQMHHCNSAAVSPEIQREW